MVSSGRIQWLMVLSRQPPGGGINTVNKSRWTWREIQSEDHQTQSEYSSGVSGRTSFQRSWSGGNRRSPTSRHHFLTCLETPPPASQQKRPSALTHSQVGPRPSTHHPHRWSREFEAQTDRNYLCACVCVSVCRHQFGNTQDPSDRTSTWTGSHREPAAETLHLAVSADNIQTGSKTKVNDSSSGAGIGPCCHLLGGAGMTVTPIIISPKIEDFWLMNVIRHFIKGN